MVPVHVVLVIIGLTTAALILLLPKGASLHRVLGRIYVVALMGTAGSSFAIYEMRSGRPSVFHAVSVLVVVLVVAVLLPFGQVVGAGFI